MIRTTEVTVLHTLAMKREAGERMRRRRLIFGRITGFMRGALIVTALVWCYSARLELTHMIAGVFTR